MSLNHKKPQGELTQAAASLDEDLAAFEVAVADAGRPQLNTRKALERCGRELQHAAELHERLQTRVAALAMQLQAAQTRAGEAATALYERGAELGRRQGTYLEIIGAYQILVAEAVAVRELSERGPEAIDELRAKLGELADQATDIAARAKEAGFRDLAEEATGRAQQLGALVGKLGGGIPTA